MRGQTDRQRRPLKPAEVGRDDRGVDCIGPIVTLSIQRATDAFKFRLNLQGIKARLARTRGERRAADIERIAREHSAIIDRVGAAAVERAGLGLNPQLQERGQQWE